MAPASVPGGDLFCTFDHTDLTKACLDGLRLEPRVVPKPEPLGNVALVILSTTCTVCMLFLLWRRASTIKVVVAHQCVSAVYFLTCISLISHDYD